MSNSSERKDDKPDLDALIREAELKVIAADRDWQRHSDQLTATLRGHAGTASKVGIWGGASLAVAAAGAGLLRWRSASRARAEAKTVVGRAKGLAQGIAKGVADKWAGLSAAPQAAAPPPKRRTAFWETVVTAVGLLLGSAARSGLKTPANGRPAVSPLLFSVALPVLSRWWRSRSQKPR